NNTDVELAEKLMLEAILDCPRVLRTQQPAAWITELGENGIAFEMRFWINDPEEGLANVRSDVLKLVWKRFKEHGIELPDRTDRAPPWRDPPKWRGLTAAPRKTRP